MTSAPANWHPDPHGRAELRYWDGNVWTDHISTDGVQGAERATAAPVERGGTIFTEPVLLVSPHLSMIELNAQCRVEDQYGHQLATAQVKQSAVKKAVRLIANAYPSIRLEVNDNTDRLVMVLTRPSRRFTLKVIVADGQGREIGRIVQTKRYGKIDFRLEAGGQAVGSMHGENWQPWTCRIEDVAGTEIARFSKTLDDQAKTTPSNPHSYAVQILRRTPEPLNTLIVASAISMGNALRSDTRFVSD